MRPIAIALACLALSGCGDAPRSDATPAPVARTTASAPNPPAPRYTTVAEIDARVDSIDAYLGTHLDRLRLFARTSGGTVVAVKDSTAWPEEMDESYNVVTDSAGRVLLHRAMPTSESGDWFEVRTHYFAPDGHTIRYDYEISGFGSGCGSILRERRRFHMGPAFTLLRQDSSYTDRDDKPIDARACERRGDHPPPASRSSGDLPGVR